MAPLTARHWDYLDELMQKGSIGIAPDALRIALGAATLLVGSAPVGPTSVSRIIKYCGRLPTVRFGSTETCLQVCGTPLCRSLVGNEDPSDSAVLTAFKAGWNHTDAAGEKCVGYYIGRAHPSHTEVMVVESAADRTAPGYLKECAPGKCGPIVTRGGNLMTRYVGNAAATQNVLREGGWYVGLGDTLKLRGKFNTRANHLGFSGHLNLLL